ncbi:MAG TPA: hypothetical protein PLE45_01845 [Spirochaetota bacterium]|nr:hypothetical protein [Spirochaetota bacterium]HOL56029.1 hypothetical protein [Spirochaetota bacterium]HPP03471.1 hypothetical protein [Spirochaetota bacterium]
MDKKELIIKKIAEYLFNKWKEEKIQEGYHLPKLCPVYEKKDENEQSIQDDIIHCNKCLIDLVSFEDLDNYLKEEYLNKAEDLYNDFSKIGLKISI